jgi:cytochrome oxidase Cu insertion factor (SCO1/SenC/PrrC family)
MSSATLSSPTRASGGRRMLALVVALLALPFVLGGGLYFLGWQPGRTGNHGHLLDPPAALPASGLRLPDGTALATADLQGKWLLLLSGSGPCGSACTQRIDEMRRIQVSLNKDMSRLRRVVLTDMPADPELLTARQRQPDLVVATAPPRWLPVAGADSAYRLRIADPHGHLIMDYPADAAAKGVRGDLERLLKFAWTG